MNLGKGIATVALLGTGLALMLFSAGYRQPMLTLSIIFLGLGAIAALVTIFKS